MRAPRSGDQRRPGVGVCGNCRNCPEPAGDYCERLHREPVTAFSQAGLYDLSRETSQAADMG